MGFDYQAGAAAGKGFDQSTQQMFGLIMQNYMQQAGQKKRQANLAKALKELHPQLSDRELEAVSALTAMGMPPGKEFLNQRMNAKTINEMVFKLPPQIRERIEGLPFEERRAFVLSQTVEQIKNIQTDIDIEKLVELKKSLTKTAEGKIDWENSDQGDILRYTSLLNEVIPDRPGDDATRVVRNYFLHGQFRLNGEEPAIFGNFTATDMKIISALKDPLYDKWAEIPLELKFFAEDKLGIKNEKDWRSFKGLRTILDIAVPLAEKVITQRIIRLLPYDIDFGTAISRWQVGGFDPIRDPETGEIKQDNFKAIREELEDTYYPGTAMIRTEVFMKEAERMDFLGNALQKHIQMSGPAKQIHHDLIMMYSRHNGTWDSAATSWMLDHGYDLESINAFKKAFEAISQGNYEDVVNKIKGDIGE